MDIKMFWDTKSEEILIYEGEITSYSYPVGKLDCDVFTGTLFFSTEGSYLAREDLSSIWYLMRELEKNEILLNELWGLV